jgi:copper(I)-binding protein
MRLLLAISTIAAAFAAPAWAQTSVAEGWVRGTVPQQKASGAFMQITSAQGGKLVAVSSPVAGIAEIHEMKMDGGVMKMGPVPALDLPAGKSVELKPGGYHVMLMELKQQLKAGDTVPLTLTVEGKDGKKETVELKLPVKALGAAAMHEGMGH